MSDRLMTDNYLSALEPLGELDLIHYFFVDHLKRKNIMRVSPTIK